MPSLWETSHPIDNIVIEFETTTININHHQIVTNGAPFIFIFGSLIFKA